MPATTFDDAVKGAGGPVQIVKMDVEGAEYDIILPSDPASWADVRKVVMEYHPVEGHSLEELTRLLRGLGIHRGPARAHGPAPGLGAMWLARTVPADGRRTADPVRSPTRPWPTGSGSAPS